ncbi:hypothetical protein [Kitasatospora sp. NPDC092286]
MTRDEEVGRRFEDTASYELDFTPIDATVPPAADGAGWSPASILASDLAL